MSSGPDQPKPDAESEIWNAVTAFERILEVIPDDRTSLDTLVHAYTQLGDHVRAFDYLKRLAKVVADEGDSEAAGSILEQLEPFADHDLSVLGLIEQLKRLTGGLPAVADETPAKTSVSSPVDVKAFKTQRVNITDELALAWDLLQAGELTQEQYAEVVQDLTNISSNALDKGAISMLHVIENRGYVNLDHILVFASTKGDVPVIRLANFDLSDEAASLLPMDYMIRQGVLPFDFLGPDVLVVIQNPYDLELRKQIEEGLGRHCHFYLTSPHDFLEAIAKIQKKKADAAKTTP
jgi:hypothetical protein